MADEILKGASADAEVSSEEQDTPEAGVLEVSADVSVPAAEIVDEPEAEAPVAAVEAAAEEATVDEPVAATEPADDAGPVVGKVEETSASASARKRKRKRLPRTLRPQRAKTKREQPKERKPIARLPKPEHVRGRRQERQGTVVSAAADKTIVVRVDTAKAHPMYKKVIRRSTKLHAHDEQNQAKVGDVVRIVETRPLSRMKRWRLQEIVEAAK